jgi:branched-chain amino acid aminotransferase
MARYAFLRGEFVPMEEAKIGISTHAFLYGTACFEGIRGYWSAKEEELFIFRLREHYQRLLDSCKIMRITPKYSLDELCDITVQVVAKCGDRTDVYIRPVYYKSSETIGVKLTGLEDDFLVFAVPFGEYLDISKGLRCRVSSWRHSEDNAIPTRAKINGVYINPALAKTEALDDGYDEAIFLSRSGHVAEGSAENFFMVRQGSLITPPVTTGLLEGITRNTVMELATDLGIPVVERLIDRSELYLCDEAFVTGTGAQVSPIVEIDHRTVGDGKIGPIATKLQQLYFQVVKGEVPQYRHWCTPVYNK